MRSDGEIGRLRPSIDDLIKLLALPSGGNEGDPQQLAQRVATELDRRVAERTARLTAANEALRREIAEHIRTEGELRASERDVRHVIDGIPALVLTLSSSGEIERANQQALSYFGRTLEEIRDSITRDLIHPHDLARATGAFAASISSGEPLEIELRIRRSDGVYPWFQARAHPLRDQSDQIERWYVLATDIDERKRVEDELRARELSSRLLVESMDSIPALAIVSNESGEIVFANRQVLSYYGRTLEDVKRWPTSVHIVHPDDLDHANQVVADALSAGVACQDEYRLRRFDGVYRWFEGRYSPVRDQDGRITNWYVLLVDIDDRKRSEDNLRQSEAFLAEGQRLSATGSFHWRVATDEIVWSDQVYRIFEVDQGAPVTLELFRSRVHPDDIPLSDEFLDRARNEGRNFESQHRLLMRDGSVKFVHLVAHAIRDADGRLEYLGAVQDVTRRRVAEEALNKVRWELAHVARVLSLGALTASIAHEINQPLSGIVTNASTSLRMLAADPPNLEGARETARRTLRDANRASDIVARLRALFSRKEASTELVDLNEAAREVLALSSSELRLDRVVVRTEFAYHLPVVRGDKVQLQQVVLNLVLNAAEAMGAIDDRPRNLVLATEREDGGHVRLSVRDAGVGVDPQRVAKLFDAFHTTKPGGMGIGLSISRSIIEAHEGRLWAEPNDGPGATFCIVLPVQPQ